MQKDWINTARTLSEALPLLQRYSGATVVIKLGGHAMSSPEALDDFARDVVLMRQVGVNPILVHGGGPMINALLGKLNIESEFIDGKRVTDSDTIGAVEMVLAGQVNKAIVRAINGQGGRAVGLTGSDGAMVRCDYAKRELGFVGQPSAVDPTVLETLCGAGMIPVVAPLGFGDEGETFNINGDTMAGALAGALKADRLLLLTDVDGVKDNTGALRTQLTPTDIADLCADGSISGGMIPKTETAIAAIHEGVRAVVILNGKASNACLLELFTDHGAGTLIRQAVPQ